jgi:hypothetical protein
MGVSFIIVTVIKAPSLSGPFSITSSASLASSSSSYFLSQQDVRCWLMSGSSLALSGISGSI